MLSRRILADLPPVPQRPPTGRAARRREISESMLPVVEAHLSTGQTFRDLVVEDLANEVGIARSTFYLYYDDRGDFLRSITEGVMTEILAATDTWWSMPPEADEDTLHEVLRSIFDAYRTRLTLMTAFVEAAGYEPSLRDTYRQLLGEAMRQLEAHIAERQAQGVVRGEVDPGGVATWLILLMERSLSKMAGITADEDELRLTATTRIVWNTLYAGSPGRAPQGVGGAPAADDAR